MKVTVQNAIALAAPVECDSLVQRLPGTRESARCGVMRAGCVVPTSCSSLFKTMLAFARSVCKNANGVLKISPASRCPSTSSHALNGPPSVRFASRQCPSPILAPTRVSVIIAPRSAVYTAAPRSSIRIWSHTRIFAPFGRFLAANAKKLKKARSKMRNTSLNALKSARVRVAVTFLRTTT